MEAVKQMRIVGASSWLDLKPKKAATRRDL